MRGTFTSSIIFNILYFPVSDPLSDYAANEGLDRYSDADINDADEIEEMSLAQRRAAEALMARRDRLERGGNRRGQRAANRSRMPNLLSDDDEDLGEGLIPSGARRRARRTYEERRDLDDMEGIEDVSIDSSLFLHSC